MEKKKTAVRLNIKIDVYENGSGVIIKRVKDKKILGARVFLKEQREEMKKFIEDTKSKA